MQTVVPTAGDHTPARARARQAGVALIALVTMLVAGLPAGGAAASTCTDSSHSTYGGGDGSAEDPFRIATAEHLRTLRDRVNADVAGSQQEDCHFLQTADIDLDPSLPGNDSSWVAIGTDTADDPATRFRGN